MKINLKRSMQSLVGVVFALGAISASALTSSVSATSTATYAGSDAALATASSIPRYDHVVIVMEENTSETTIYGNTSGAPYINSLKDNGVYFTQSFAVTHPSQPNYLALFSGAVQGISDDSCPHTFSVNNLGNQLRTAGFSFTGYSESMPSNGYTGCTSGTYARKHSPWVNFSDLPTTTNLTYASFPTNFTTLPTLSFVIPNLCDDMHDCSTVTGDTWLKNNLDAYAQWAKTHNSLLIVTWDEDDSTTSANQVATIFYGANLKNGAYAETITHYSVLRTLEDMFGLAALGGAASATPISDVWSSTAPDFSVTAAPSALSIVQGAGTSDAITVSSVGAFSAPVSLSVTGLPSGVTASFAPTSVTPPQGGSATGTLTLTAASTATTGNATITVTATSGALAHSATISLGVNPAPNFSLAAAPVNLSIALGASGTDTTTVTSLNGFNAPVTLSVSGLPSGVTATFGNNPVTPAVNGSANSVLTINVPATSNLGTWTLTLTGTSGSLSHTATFNLTVNQPPPVDFGISASPASLSLTQGTSASDTVTVLSSNGFNSAVSFAVSGLPAGVSASFSPTSVTPAANASASTALTLTASATAVTGTATLTITGTSGSLVHSATISLTVVPISSNVLQNGMPVSNLSAAKGAQLNYTVNVPAGASNLVIATSGGSGDSDLYVKFGAAPTLSVYDCRPYISGNAETCTFAAPQAGTYYVMLNGYAAFSGLTLKASWSVSASDFSVATSPSSLAVTQGASGSDTISVASLGGFNSAVNLNVSGLPNGVTATFSPTSVTPPANGSVSSTLTLTASSTATTGTAAVTIIGTSGSTTHSATISLTVNPAGGGSTQLLGNTGFESTASWTASSGVICATGCSGESAHAGSGFAWLNGYGSTHTDTLSQGVTIPSGKTSATLQYFLHIDTAETGTTATDKLTVQVLNSSGAVLATLATYSNLNAANGFGVQTNDLSAYIGQTVTIKFSGVENSSKQTSFVLDDVTLTVQ